MSPQFAWPYSRQGRPSTAPERLLRALQVFYNLRTSKKGLLGRFACKGHVGAKGISLEEPDDVKEGLAAALASKAGPIVVDVVVDSFALSLTASAR